MFLPELKKFMVTRAIICPPLPELRYLKSVFKPEKKFSYLGFDFYILNSTVITGKILGAPQVPFVLRVLKQMGVRKALILGWSAALKPPLYPGDIFVPTSALSKEGVSRWYSTKSVFYPDKTLRETILEELKSVEPKQGRIVSVDVPFVFEKAPFRFIKDKNTIAVDMETSAFFCLARLLNLKISALHFITDKAGETSNVRPEGELLAKNEMVKALIEKFLTHAL